MSAPIEFVLTREYTSSRLRQIEAEYHLQLAAENSGELVKGMQALYRQQGASAEQALRASGEHHQEQLAALGRQTELLDRQIRETGQLRCDIQELGQGVADGFRTMEIELGRIYTALTRIETLIANPADTAVQELIRRSTASLRAAARASGRERDAAMRDVELLLEEVLRGAFGRTNYVAHFQSGWLAWKHHGDLERAEERFFDASRLSRDFKDDYRLMALRHHAHVLHELGRNAEALDALDSATREFSQSADAHFDHARILAITGESTQAVGHLQRAISLRPALAISARVEEAFQ